jgi:hypothetical protein
MVYQGISNQTFLNLPIKRLRLGSHVKSFANFSCQLIDSDSSLGDFYPPFLMQGSDLFLLWSEKADTAKDCRLPAI